MKLTSVGIATLLTQTLTVAIAAAEPEPPIDGNLPTEIAMPLEAPAPTKDKKEPGTAGYDKGFYVRSHDEAFSVKLSGRLQPYWTFSHKKDEDPSGGFELRRARLVLEGNLHGKGLLYKMQTDFGKGAVGLRDFHVDVKLGGETWLRFGQWKRPFSRQQITSSARLEVTDRAITDKGFGAGRDIGVAVRNDYEKSPDIEWILGVFNGTGIDPTQKVTVDTMAGTASVSTPTNVPTRFRPMVVGRVGVNRGGIKGYSEADLEGGPLRWGAAASVQLEGDFDKNDQSSEKVQVDAIVKANGFSTTAAVYAMTGQTGIHTFGDQELSFVGFHAQAGYMLSPKTQAVVRYSLIDARADDGVDQQEITIGGGYYGYGHDAKVQGALRLIKSGDAQFGDALLFELESNVGF